MKRFYESASAENAERGYQVHLDGRAVRTALGKQQIVPTKKLADALTAEWNRQGEKIDPAHFNYRDLTDFAIDMVAPDSEPAHHQTPEFLGDRYALLPRRSRRAIVPPSRGSMEPVLAAFEQREGVKLERICGIMHLPQSPATHAAIKARLECLDPFVLTGLLTMTSLATSLTIGLSALEEDADMHTLWSAANLEENWQIEQWGTDC